MNSDFLCEKRLSELNPYYHTLVRNTAFVLCHTLEKYKTYFPDFTDHTILHSLQVIDFCNQLLGENVNLLNEDELYVLLMSAYLHDSGMGISESDYKELYDVVVSEKYKLSHPHDNIHETIRSFHQNFSKKFIYKYASIFDIPSEEHVHAIALVSEGHRKSNLYDEKYIPSVLKVPNGNVIHVPFLCALIRLADELDIAADRNIEIGEDNQDTIFKMMHRAIKHLVITPEKFILEVETEDHALFDGVSKEIAKLNDTLILCKDVVAQRSPFSISQTKVVIERKHIPGTHINIVDSDLGTDDALAFLVAAKLGLKIDYLVTSTGNTDIDGAVRNAHILKKYLGLDSKIVRGLTRVDDKFSSGDEKNTFHGEDGLAGESRKMLSNLQISDDDIRNTLSFEDFTNEIALVDSITYISIGALTNLSKLLDDPTFAKKWCGIYVMGGGMKEFNCSHDTEFNFSKDPKSVNKLLSTGYNITLFPLDVTNYQRISSEEIDALENGGKYPEYIAFLRHNLKANKEFNNIDAAVVHDVLPILYQIDPHCFMLDDMRIVSDEYGRTYVSPDGEAIHVCLGVRKSSVLNAIFKAFD